MLSNLTWRKIFVFISATCKNLCVENFYCHTMASALLPTLKQIRKKNINWIKVMSSDLKI